MTAKIDGNGLITGAGINPLGQCRLVKSGANLVLQPYQGALVTINGVPYPIPAAGVSLAPTGAAASTSYLIYLLQTAGVLSLEFSTTAHATDTNTTTGNQGQEIKSGDPTRTLVGQARTDASVAWADTEAQRFVISWFNPRPIKTRAWFTATRTSVATSFSEVNTEIRNEFLSWGDKAAQFSINGNASVNAALGFGSVAVGLDGVVQDGVFQYLSINSGNGVGISVNDPLTLTEGYHYTTLMSSVAANTVSYVGGGTVASRTTLQGIIQG